VIKKLIILQYTIVELKIAKSTNIYFFNKKFEEFLIK